MTSSSLRQLMKAEQGRRMATEHPTSPPAKKFRPNSYTVAHKKGILRPPPEERTDSDECRRRRVRWATNKPRIHTYEAEPKTPPGTLAALQGQGSPLNGLIYRFVLQELRRKKGLSEEDEDESLTEEGGEQSGLHFIDEIIESEGDDEVSDSDELGSGECERSGETTGSEAQGVSDVSVQLSESSKVEGANGVAPRAFSQALQEAEQTFANVVTAEVSEQLAAAEKVRDQSLASLFDSVTAVAGSSADVVVLEKGDSQFEKDFKEFEESIREFEAANISQNGITDDLRRHNEEFTNQLRNCDQLDNVLSKLKHELDEALNRNTPSSVLPPSPSQTIQTTTQPNYDFALDDGEAWRHRFP